MYQKALESPYQYLDMDLEQKWRGWNLSSLPIEPSQYKGKRVRIHESTLRVL